MAIMIECRVLGYSTRKHSPPVETNKLRRKSLLKFLEFSYKTNLQINMKAKYMAIAAFEQQVHWFRYLTTQLF